MHDPKHDGWQMGCLLLFMIAIGAVASLALPVVLVWAIIRLVSRYA